MKKLLRAALRISAAVGLIIVGAAVYLTQPLLTAPSARPLPSADRAALRRTVEKLSREFVPRDCEHPKRLAAAAEFIRAEFAASGAATREQPYEADGKQYKNVIATFGIGASPAVVVGAHYDACGELPAADDNASGVAGLLELARLLAKSPPATRVDLVAYNTEEPPYFRTEQMGSVVHAKSLRAAGTELRAMISLEMIGYFSDEAGSQGFPSPLLHALYPSKGNFIAVVGKIGGGSLVRTVKAAMASAAPLPVYSLNAPGSLMGIDLSDHRSYWAEGYPAVMITDTAFFRNRAYHTDLDTADRLDYERMAQVVEGTLAAVHELAR